MKNGIGEALESLLRQRNELVSSLERIEVAINALRGLEGSSGRGVSISGGSLAKLSIYEAAVRILERKSPLTTDEVVDALKAGGRKASRVIISTTMYKAVKDKKDCKIALAGRGKWKLA